MLHPRKDAGNQPETTRTRRRPTRLLLSIIAIMVIIGIFVTPNINNIHHAFADTNANTPTLTVDASSGRHAISQDIYGVNLYAVDAKLVQELKAPVQRWGGNNTSRYNWLVDSTNPGDNYFYEGGGDGVYMGGSNLGQGNGVPGASADRFVKAATAQGSKAMLTVPMLPYINKTSDFNCSYPKSLYPPQQAYSTEKLPNGDVCGNGHDVNGNPITDTNIGLNNTPNSPELQKAWVDHLVKTHGTTAKGGVNIYELDNETSYWTATHHDVHPDKTGYDEIVNLTQAYAQAVKQADPTALIDGPGDFGWWGYTGEFAKPGDDRASHGNVNLGEYYLQKMHAYEQQHGVRLLNYFDEHYYPANKGACLSLCPAGDATTQQQRLQSTRSLWDPTYVDNSWIGDKYGSIQLLPRFHDWINKDYPGTKLAITEYNFGGNESINGALTQADVLGIFGREQVDLATMWGPPTADQPGANAFRIYRNYDGKGSKYGDTWIKSASSDQGQLSVYGAQRSSDKALTLVMINKTGNDLTSPLALSGAEGAKNAQVYTYSGADLKSIVHQSDQAVGSNGFTRTYPANSITMVVIPTEGVGSNPTPTPAPGDSLFKADFENGQPTWTNTVDDGGYPAGGVKNVEGVCCNLSGPEAGVRNETAHSGANALMYSGKDTDSTSAHAYTKVFDLSSQNITVGNDTTLDYWIYPQSQKTADFANISGSNSTCTAIDLIFVDRNGKQSNLRDAGAVDQNGNRIQPAYQCNKLTLDTWNHVIVKLGTTRSGVKITRLDVGHDQHGNTGGYRGYIDDVSIHND